MNGTTLAHEASLTRVGKEQDPDGLRTDAGLAAITQQMAPVWAAGIGDHGAFVTAAADLLRPHHGSVAVEPPASHYEWMHFTPCHFEVVCVGRTLVRVSDAGVKDALLTISTLVLPA